MFWKKSDPKAAQLPAKTPWRALAIVPCPQACQAARAAVPMRWLYTQVPRLPLTGCDQSQCDCRYRHLPDRRSEDRRRIDRTGLPRNFDGAEQRSRRRGRRASD